MRTKMKILAQLDFLSGLCLKGTVKINNFLIIPWGKASIKVSKKFWCISQKRQFFSNYFRRQLTNLATANNARFQ